MNLMKINENFGINLDLIKVLPKRIFTKSGNKIYNLNFGFAGERILISKAKDKKGNVNKRFIRVPENQICLWYKWPVGRNQFNKENNSYRFKYVLLPRYIQLDKLTLNALGLLQAEMTKYTKRASNIIFANSDPNLINIVLRFFERLFIKNNKWSWNITFNFKLKNKESKLEIVKREEEALNYWKSKTMINPQKNQNRCLQYSGNKKYQNMRANSPRYGSLRVIFSNIIIYQVILKLLKDVRKIIKEDEDTIKYYLQGIIAGEGYVKPSKHKSLDSVRIGCVNKKEKLFYHNLLQYLNIGSSIEKQQVSISGQANFLKIYKLDLIRLHSKKYNVFLNSMMGFKQISLNLKDEFLKERALRGN